MTIPRTRWLAIPALALAVLLVNPANPAVTPDADAAPRAAARDNAQAPHEKRIKPYKNERKQRYTTESTEMPGAAPCAVLPADHAAWPKGIEGCYGPPPAPPKQQRQAAAPPPAPAKHQRQAAAPPPAPRSTGTGAGGGPARSPQPASSCG